MDFKYQFPFIIGGKGKYTILRKWTCTVDYFVNREHLKYLYG